MSRQLHSVVFFCLHPSKRSLVVGVTPSYISRLNVLLDVLPIEVETHRADGVHTK